jgi:Tannase and feruloyl esterase
MGLTDYQVLLDRWLWTPSTCLCGRGTANDLDQLEPERIYIVQLSDLDHGADLDHVIETARHHRLQITASFYGQPVAYSYWNGCSTGGRQGLMEAQRYPADSNGILAASPAINWDRFTVAEFWPPGCDEPIAHLPTAVPPHWGLFGSASANIRVAFPCEQRKCGAARR